MDDGVNPADGGLPAMQVSYEFVSVHRIVGLANGGLENDQAIDIGVPTVEVVLTLAPDKYLAAIDRHQAVGNLIIRSLVGQRGEGEALQLVEQIAQEICADRTKSHGLPTPCVVVRAIGTADTKQTAVARSLGNAFLTFDAVDRDAITKSHRALVREVLTATALVVDRTSLEIVPIVEGVSTTFPDGRPLYSVTVTSDIKMATARPVDKQDASRIALFVTQLRRTPSLSTPSRLFADALQSGDDDLQQFVLAWAALEILIKKNASGLENGDWVTKVVSELRAEAQSVHEGFVKADRKNYRLLEQLEALLLMLRPTDGADLTREVAEIKNLFREPLFHTGAVPKEGFPGARLIRLTRRLIEVVIGEPSAKVGS